jgi:hypothetical protein
MVAIREQYADGVPCYRLPFVDDDEKNIIRR